MSSDPPPTKKIKTTQAGTPVFTDLDLSLISPKFLLQGINIHIHNRVRLHFEHSLLQVLDLDR